MLYPATILCWYGPQCLIAKTIMCHSVKKVSSVTTELYWLPSTNMKLISLSVWPGVKDIDSRSKGLEFDSHCWSCVEVLVKLLISYRLCQTSRDGYLVEWKKKSYIVKIGYSCSKNVQMMNSPQRRQDWKCVFQSQGCNLFSPLNSYGIWIKTYAFIFWIATSLKVDHLRTLDIALVTYICFIVIPHCNISYGTEPRTLSTLNKVYFRDLHII